MTTVRIALPAHLRTLARVGSEVRVDVPDAPTIKDVLDALESAYPELRGTIRDQATGRRRAFMRYFASGRDLSHEPTDEPLPDAVARGADVFGVVGAIAGGEAAVPGRRPARRRSDMIASATKREAHGEGAAVNLEGIHHISAITADAPRNVDFYARVLGLRQVKRTVNQDDPTVYHLFYGDEEGSPGADLTFFEYPGASPGRAGAGMIHRIGWRVASEEALDYWADRLGGEGVSASRDADGLRFADPEGLEHLLAVVATPDPPLVARSAEVPDGYALQGFEGVRAYARDPGASAPLLRDALGLAEIEPGQWEARGAVRGGRIAYDRATDRGRSGAGTVHHVAWSSTMEDHEAWLACVLDAGAHATPVIDRFYFRSIYFREPSGVLFEIATMGPGFAIDEPPETMGERLSLPPRFEPLRERLAGILTPLPDTRPWRRAGMLAAARGGDDG